MSAKIAPKPVQYLHVLVKKAIAPHNIDIRGAAGFVGVHKITEISSLAQYQNQAMPGRRNQSL